MMKTDSLSGLAWVICLLFSNLLIFAEETPPPLFPDLAGRYKVGDPEADNPLRETEGPKTLAAADMNGDGWADVICGNLDGSISVLLSKGPADELQDQILQPGTGLLTNSSLRGLTVADMNGDTRPDVVVADVARHGIVTLLGNGDGTLTPFERTDLGPARTVHAADFNGDGKMDLVVGASPASYYLWYYAGYSNLVQNPTNRSVAVLMGNGDGTFQPPQYVFGPSRDVYFYDVAAADLNQDGHVDIAALDWGEWYDAVSSVWIFKKRLLIFVNRGDGTFNRDQPDLILQVEGQGSRSIAVAYLDEDLSGGNPPPGATLDIIVANRDSSTLEVFLNQGGLSFQAPFQIPAGDSPRDVAVGDLDGDGQVDLVVVNRNTDTISVLTGRGGGRFSPPILELPTGKSPRLVALADINADGALDAAVNNRISGDVSLFIGQQGLAGFLLPEGYYPAGFTPVSLVAEDFNGDGQPDLATANLRSHDVRVRLNEGGGLFGAETVYLVNASPAFIVAGDVNQDGKLDLVVSCLGSAISWSEHDRSSLVTLLGRGDGTFQAPIVTLLGSTGFQPYWLRLADLSGDATIDVAVSSLRGSLLLLEGRGDGTFRATARVGSLDDGRPLGFALGDYDKNGWLDVATSRGVVMLNDGQFFSWTNSAPNEPPPVRTMGFNSGTQAWAVETEDLDGDGILDLMVALTFRRPDPIGVLFGKGDGSFTEPDVYEGPDVGAVALWATDMDGDSIKDIVVGNRCAATIIIMKGDGHRKFTLREIVSAYSVEDVAVADLNGDSRPDLAAAGIGVWAILNGVTNRLGSPRLAQSAYQVGRSGVFINEIMAFNVSFLSTYGMTPDWVELYNHSGVVQVLDRWSLAQLTADGETNRWYFPSGTRIDPWAHLFVFCKKKPGTAPGLFANFELSASGENLALLSPDGSEVDRVEFPALPADVSYARFLDGAPQFAYNPSPTFGSANLRPGNLDPTIERKDPFVGPAGSALMLTARTFDDVGIAYAAVCYRVAGQGGDFIEVPMSDDGLHGDKAAGDGYYGATLPALPSGAEIEYWLRAVDLEGQLDNSPDEPEDPAKLHRLVVPVANASLRLTELVAANLSGLKDETGRYEDWIEVANTGQTVVDLGGYSLAKDYFEPQNTWQFPSNFWVAPGQRVVVFCDDDPADGPLHATFKLQRDSDRVFLIRNDAARTIVDSLSFGPLPSDASFGVLDRGVVAQMLAWPTPGADNLSMPPRQDPDGLAVEMFGRWFPGQMGAPGSFGLRWMGEAAGSYGVEWSDDLRTWHPVAVSPTHLGEGLHQWVDTDGAVGKRFYRVLRNP